VARKWPYNFPATNFLASPFLRFFAPFCGRPRNRWLIFPVGLFVYFVYFVGSWLKICLPSCAKRVVSRTFNKLYCRGLWLLLDGQTSLDVLFVAANGFSGAWWRGELENLKIKLMQR